MIIKIVRPFLHAERRNAYDVLKVEDEYVIDKNKALEELEDCRDWLNEEIENMKEVGKDPYDIREVQTHLSLIEEQIKDIEKYEG